MNGKIDTKKEAIHITTAIASTIMYPTNAMPSVKIMLIIAGAKHCPTT